MPIEIRELLIKVTVLDNTQCAAGPLPQPVALTGEELRRFQQELVQTCVRQVLAELERQRER